MAVKCLTSAVWCVLKLLQAPLTPNICYCTTLRAYVHSRHEVLIGLYKLSEFQIWSKFKLFTLTFSISWGLDINPIVKDIITCGISTHRFDMTLKSNRSTAPYRKQSFGVLMVISKRFIFEAWFDILLINKVNFCKCPCSEKSNLLVAIIGLRNLCINFYLLSWW